MGKRDVDTVECCFETRSLDFPSANCDDIQYRMVRVHFEGRVQISLLLVGRELEINAGIKRVAKMVAWSPLLLLPA